MSMKSELEARHLLFIFKAAACFAALLVGSVLLAPKARMQNGDAVMVSNTAVVINNNSYRPSPTPIPLKATVRGRVFYEDTGRPVRRTSITLMGKSGNGRDWTGLTDNNGNFQIKDVVAGTYYAFVNAPGIISPLAYADLSKPKNEGLEEAFENFAPIIVSGIGDLEVQIPARRGGAISGRIMYADGDPAIGVKVEILHKVREKFVPVVPNFSAVFSMMMGSGGGFQTDDRGVYRFSGLPNGEYIVKVSENVSHGDNRSRGYGGLDETLFSGSSLLTMFYPNVLTTDKAQTVSVAAGQEMSEINIFIPERDLFSVEGKLINSKDRSPVKNAMISLKKTGENTISLFDDAGRRQQSSKSDAEGSWSLKELPKGTYTLTIEPSNYDYSDDDYSEMTNSNRTTGKPPKPRLAKKIQEITIDNQNLSEIVIELGYGASISGTVKTENNQKMPSDVTLTAVQENTDVNTSTSIYNENSAGSGVYAMNANAGNLPRTANYDFKLENVASGKNFLWATVSDDDYYVKSATLNGVDLLTNPIELKEGDVLKNVQFIISKNAGTLQGTVVDDEKHPVQRAEFTLVPIEAAKRKNPNFRRGAKTGENGEFEVKAAPNEYAIVFFTKDYYAKQGEERDAWLNEAVKSATKITIKPNETEKISLIVPK